MNLTRRPDTTEIEMGLLGGLMKNNAGLLDIDLRPDELRPGHDRIFSRFQELYREKGHFSPLDFTDWQMNETMVQGMNAHEHVKQCYHFNTTSTADQLREYVELIRETHRKIDLLEMAEMIQADAWERPYHELAAELAAKLEEIAPASDFLTGEELRAAVLKSLEMPRRRFPVGIPELDTAMGGGLYEGYTYGFCGAEKMGKTTLAHTLSYNLDKAGTKHLYIALEMDSVQIEQRNIARDLGINSLEFLKPNHGYARAVANLPPRKNIVLKDAPGANLQDIINYSAKAKLKYKIEGFIVDYWQLVTGKIKGETEESHLRNVAQTLAAFSRKNKLWCILLAQQNQDGKLFGGNGLRKACDQLYMIEPIEGNEAWRWLRLDASRYTFRTNIGSEKEPGLILDVKVGPHFRGA